jgi:hypothetical protein
LRHEHVTCAKIRHTLILGFHHGGRMSNWDRCKIADRLSLVSSITTGLVRDKEKHKILLHKNSCCLHENNKLTNDYSVWWGSGVKIWTFLSSISRRNIRIFEEKNTLSSMLYTVQRHRTFTLSYNILFEGLLVSHLFRK